MHLTCDFQLVLCANVWEPAGEHAVRVLEKAVAAGKASGGFDDAFSKPFVR